MINLLDVLDLLEVVLFLLSIIVNHQLEDFWLFPFPTVFCNSSFPKYNLWIGLVSMSDF